MEVVKTIAKSLYKLVSVWELLLKIDRFLWLDLDLLKYLQGWEPLGLWIAPQHFRI